MNTLQEEEGYGIRCSISEFIWFLQNPGIRSKQNMCGWVFLNFQTVNELQKDSTKMISKNSTEMVSFPTENEEKEKIRCVLEAATSNLGNKHLLEFMVQFWAVEEDFLTTVDQPFAVFGALFKGYCWYKKICEGHKYSVKEGVSEEEAGGVGRAYLNRNPESTPDLRLYSINQFPLRNEAARCGLRSYLAMPVFDLVKKKCYGVLEIVSPQIDLDSTPIFSLVDPGLKKAGLRSTHIGFSSINAHHEEPTFLLPDSDILKMIKSATELVPQLHLVQVWSPCKQCVNMSNDLSCMQRVALRNSRPALNCIKDPEIFHYLHASEFHCLQIGKWIGKPLMSVDRKSCFCRNICDFSICENPLAHYAQRARLSFCFVVHLQSMHDNNTHHLVEFFFQSNSREDASFLHLLLQIMEKELLNFKFEKSIVELRKTSALTTYEYVEWKHQHSHSEEVDMLIVMKDHSERFSYLDFIKYLQDDSYCLQPDVPDNKVSNYTALPNILMMEKIKKVIIEIANKSVWRSYSLVQFWAVGIYEDKPCLQISRQPYALGSFYKGLVFFRKLCIDHRYFVDEELGPLQRVFRSRRPETSPDLRLYSTTEFPLRDHALRCHLKRYIAFPILDQHKKCIGVLEYVGTDIADDDEVEIICNIERALEAASFGSTQINFMRSPTRQVDPSRRLAETEIRMALQLVDNIPQLFYADVWVTHNNFDGVSSKICCMVPAINHKLGWPVTFHPVQNGKGIIGMVLASKNKSCFCRNLCTFGISDQPLSHYLQRDRADVCYAICLRSSHCWDLLYVLQFFLFQGPASYEYICSFLHSLFPILKQKLTSFKVASGQQLGDDLVVDVVQLPQGNGLTSPELDESSPSPSKFKTMVYSQKEPQHSDNELRHLVPVVKDSAPSVSRAKPSNVATSGSSVKEKLGRKRKGSPRVKVEDLQPHSVKKIEHSAEELGVGRSTIKLSCNEKYIKNRSLFEAAGTSDHSCSTVLPTPDMSVATNLPPTYANTTMQQVAVLQPESETVMVKVKYEDEIIKFKLYLSSTMNNLLEEVGRRLGLEIGSFKLRYLDEDSDNILLACDDDLQLCLKSQAALNKTNVQLFVQSIRK